MFVALFCRLQGEAIRLAFNRSRAMNESTRKVSPLRQRMIEEMRMRQLAPKTRDAYIRAVLHFTRFLGRSPDTATAEDLRRYQLHCVDQGISAITLNATITGLKFLFEATLGQPELMAKMHPVRMSRTLPIILSREEVSRLRHSSARTGREHPDHPSAAWT
jgi:integrase/recombinase XerD